jgi:hypothetical protein
MALVKEAVKHNHSLQHLDNQVGEGGMCGWQGQAGACGVAGAYDGVGAGQQGTISETAGTQSRGAGHGTVKVWSPSEQQSLAVAGWVHGHGCRGAWVGGPVVGGGARPWAAAVDPAPPP